MALCRLLLLDDLEYWIEGRHAGFGEGALSQSSPSESVIWGPCRLLVADGSSMVSRSAGRMIRKLAPTPGVDSKRIRPLCS